MTAVQHDMTNMEQFWQAAWSWIVVNSSVERVSLVISLLAFSVAVRGVRHARRSARAAEIQAKAAEEQVDAAKEQVIAAREQMWSSRAAESERIAEVSALIEYRGFMESSLPKIVIGLESAEYPPLWNKCEWGGRGEEGSKYPSLDSRRNFIVYNTNENEHDELSFLIRGLMINVGEVAAHVLADEPNFVEGESSLVAGNVPIPQRLGRGREYLLKPGETALFEWSASRSVQQWADLYKNSHRRDFDEIPDGWKSSINRPVGRFNIRLAGSASDAAMLISIDMDENVIWPNFNSTINDRQAEGEEWVTHTAGRVHVYVKQEYALLPKNLDDLRRLLKPLNLWGKVED